MRRCGREKYSQDTHGERVSQSVDAVHVFHALELGKRAVVGQIQHARPQANRVWPRAPECPEKHEPGTRPASKSFSREAVRGPCQVAQRGGNSPERPDAIQIGRQAVSELVPPRLQLTREDLERGNNEEMRVARRPIPFTGDHSDDDHGP